MKYTFVTLHIKTSNAAKIINESARRNIVLKNVKTKANSLCVTLSQERVKEMVRIAELFNAETQIVSQKGLGGGLKYISVHAGLVVGVLLAIIVTGILSCFVVKFDINCDLPQYSGEVEKLLADNNIIPFTARSQIDTNAVEKLVLEQVKEAVFVSCHIEGMSLNIDVVCEEYPDEIKGNEGSINCVQEGVVTRVIVRSGTAVVKQGDRVKIGDTLIGDYYIVDNDKYDDVIDGEHLPMPAKGEVYGSVYHHIRLYIPSVAISCVRTGNKQTIRTLSIGNINIGKEKASKFEKYESVVSYSMIEGIIPIRVKTVTYYELVDTEIDRDVYRENMLLKAREEIISKIPTHGKIISDNTVSKTVDNQEVIDIYYEVEQRLDII